MLDYTIHTPISSITCDFACLSVFARFKFVSQIMRVEEDYFKA